MMRDLPTAHELAGALGGKPIGNGQWMAKCPAHQERTGSLAIKDGYAGVLVHCFGGCSQDEVIQALADRGLWHDRRDREEDGEEARRKRQERDRKAAVDRLDYGGQKARQGRP